MYYINIKFEWDTDKSRANLQKHGISFEEATEIFRGPVFTAQDRRRDYGEKRFVSIGALSGVVFLVVAHTDRKGKVRIISVRRANQTERGLYYEYFKEKAKRGGLKE
jgi:uncharacterized DUF497 family protein